MSATSVARSTASVVGTGLAATARTAARVTARTARWAVRNVLPLVAATLALATAAALLVGPYRSWDQMRDTHAQLSEQLTVLEQHNRDQAAKVERARSQVATRDDARGRFGLVRPGDVLVRLDTERRAPAAPTTVVSSRPGG